jgi:protein TonB
MTAGGFFEPRKLNPTSLTIVIALHGAALTALALSRTEIARPIIDRTIVKFIPNPKPPEPTVEPPPPTPKPIEASAGPTVVPPIVDRLPTPRPPIANPPIGPEPIGPTGAATVDPPAPPEPIRTEAQFDQRFAHLMQPAYPASEQRAEREGVVRIKVLIGADGKVKAAQPLSSASTAFWQATERHALRHWRFKPATIDGKPVESWKVMTVRFEMTA